MNYQELKQEIDNVVKTNGQKSISGSSLNELLQDMVETDESNGVGYVELGRENTNSFDWQEFAEASKKFAWLSGGWMKTSNNYGGCITFRMVPIIGDDGGIVSIRAAETEISRTKEGTAYPRMTLYGEHEVYSKSLADETFALRTTVETCQPQGGMLPNVMYNLGLLSGDTTFAFASPSDNSIANHYFFTFSTGATAPIITWPAAIGNWFGGSAPTINAFKHYEVSVLDGYALYVEYDISE